MDANELEQLKVRLAQLESFKRRLSRAVVVVLVLLASGVWMAQRPVTKTPPRRKTPPAPVTPKVVEAEQFVLKTASGQVLATLAMTDGGPTLRLVGPNAKDRAVLGLDATGTPRLIMSRADGSQAVSIALTADGVPRVEVTAKDKSKARLTTGPEGPEIAIADAAGMLRLALDLKADGPAMTMGGKTALAAFSATEDGPTVALSDPEGHARMMMKVVTNHAGFSILDVAGRALVGLEVKAENPALGLYGSNGKALFVKP